MLLANFAKLKFCLLLELFNFPMTANIKLISKDAKLLVFKSVNLAILGKFAKLSLVLSLHLVG